MGKVSIIIPVYNAEKYLETCISSILKQTMSEYMIILVDDGSFDNSGSICDRFAQLDQRIQVIHQLNYGPSKARNEGIALALHDSECEYITFVDADDSLHPQFLEYMLESVKESGSDIAMCHHNYIRERQKHSDFVLYNYNNYTKLGAEDLMIMESSSLNYIWGKLYHRNCFESVRFPDNISFGEDNLIIFRIIFEARSIVLLEASLYNYFYTSTGITKSPWKTDSLAVFQGIEEQLAYYKANGYKRAYQKEVELYIQQCAFQMHRIRENRTDYSKNKKYLKGIRTKMKQLLKTNPKFSLRHNYYWLEALYPFMAFLVNKVGQVKRRIRKS